MKRAYKHRKTYRKKTYKRTSRKRHAGGSQENPFNAHTPTYPPKEINDLISHVIYMNLDRRKDRRKHMERELSIFDPSKVTRVSGVVEEIGTTGCAKSHLKAIELARDKKYPNVLILEDDSRWQNIDEAFPILKDLLTRKYDGIMLSTMNADYDKDTLRLHSGLGANAYILPQSSYQMMIDMFKDGISNRESKRINQFGSHVWANGITRNAQAKGKWYLTAPSLMIQVPNYSDNEKTYANYSGIVA